MRILQGRQGEADYCYMVCTKKREKFRLWQLFVPDVAVVYKKEVHQNTPQITQIDTDLF